MAQTILTPRQQLLLTLLFQQEGIKKYFYLSGGTALAEYYLHHRYSEDLDFFTSQEVDPMAIRVVLKKIQRQTGYVKIDYQQSFNRNLFFLHFTDGEIIKTEFTYYPFINIEQPRVINNARIDSLIDIAVNKTFTIYQKPRSRDFIDLYLILKKKKWLFEELLRKARIKFDTPIDPLQLAQQLLQVDELKDYPRMLIDQPYSDLEKFWLSEVTKLKSKAIK
ncbi:MAG: nucleotidyl transferase AbiEii/AbiGii toxin family protein [bacterium]|nr:nucleotidyl transferase AbiEii/AbiGii toxin family protein [bacterium]